MRQADTNQNHCDCTNAGPEYGCRVEEGIRNYSPENTSSQEPIGAEGAEDAPENASKKAPEADLYYSCKKANSSVGSLPSLFRYQAA
ncbi:hypothetical protein BIV59_02745 [Bacillus sp. MUM 13]|nr:hypothetical protein BIV59_02745 [Bacillus sp. MUM 13]